MKNWNDLITQCYGCKQYNTKRNKKGKFVDYCMKRISPLPVGIYIDWKDECKLYEDNFDIKNSIVFAIRKLYTPHTLIVNKGKVVDIW